MCTLHIGFFFRVEFVDDVDVNCELNHAVRLHLPTGYALF